MNRTTMTPSSQPAFVPTQYAGRTVEDLEDLLRLHVSQRNEAEDLRDRGVRRHGGLSVSESIRYHETRIAWLHEELDRREAALVA